jgi:outer membrane protein
MFVCTLSGLISKAQSRLFHTLLGCLLIMGQPFQAHADSDVSPDGSSNAMDAELVIPTPAEIASGQLESAEEVEHPAGGEKIVLSLSQAIDNALINNLDLELSRYAPELALARWKEASGVYDPDFFANYGYSSSKRQSSFAFDASVGLPVIENRQVAGGTGLTGEIPMFGARYGIEYSGSQAVTKGTDNLLLSPENNSGVEATLSIPLLRDLIWNQSWTRIQSRELEHLATREDFRRNMMDIVNETERAYWSLIATLEKTRVDQKSLEATQALLKQTEAQFEVGTVSKVEVIEAEAGVAERELNLIRSENAYRAAQDNLIDIIAGERLTATTELSVTASDKLEDVELRELDVKESMDAAISYRPELAAARFAVDRREVEQKFAKNQKMPRFDIDTAYGVTGVTGKSTLDDTNLGGYTDTHKEYDDHDSWRTMGTFSIPLGNRVASERKLQADIEVRRANTEYTRTQQGIVMEIRQAVRNLRSAAQGITASDRRSEAAKEQLRAEEIRLRYGDSTPFDVLQKERDLVDAESQRIASYQLYRVSLAALERAQGTILRSHQIQIDGDRAVQ